MAPVEPESAKRVENALVYFIDPDRRQEFFRVFKELQDAYEIISPDPFLRPHLGAYAGIADLYRVVYAEYSPQAKQRRIEQQLLEKTDSLIRSHVQAGPVAEPLPLYPINGNIADVVKADNVSEQVKVINLHRSIMAEIEDLADTQPYLLSIGDAVEQVIQRLLDRQISVQTALEEMVDRAEQMVTGQRRTAARASWTRSPLVSRWYYAAVCFGDRSAEEQEELSESVAEVLRDHTRPAQQ